MSADLPQRTLPNILICGTPGTGKTTTSQLLYDRLSSLYPSTHPFTTSGAEGEGDGEGGFKLLTIGDLVKTHQLHTGHDAEWDAYDVDDDKLLDFLEPLCVGTCLYSTTSDNLTDGREGENRSGGGGGGCILDWHECELFPASWLDLIIVLRCNHTRLWDRLASRGYALRKIQENNEAEIMQVVLDDALEYFPQECVVELQSDDVDQMDQNVGRIVAWVEQWVKDRQ